MLAPFFLSRIPGAENDYGRISTLYQLPSSPLKQHLIHSAAATTNWIELFSQYPGSSLSVEDRASLLRRQIAAEFGEFSIVGTPFAIFKKNAVVIVKWSSGSQAFFKPIDPTEIQNDLWVPFDAVSTDEGGTIWRLCPTIARPFRFPVDLYISWWLGGKMWEVYSSFFVLPPQTNGALPLGGGVRPSEKLKEPKLINKRIGKANCTHGPIKNIDQILIRRGLRSTERSKPLNPEERQKQEEEEAKVARASLAPRVLNFNHIPVNIVDVLRLEMAEMGINILRALDKQRISYHPAGMQYKTLVGSYPTDEERKEIEAIRHEWRNFVHSIEIEAFQFKLPGGETHVSASLDLGYLIISWKSAKKIGEYLYAASVGDPPVELAEMAETYSKPIAWRGNTPYNSVVQGIQALASIRLVRVEGKDIASDAFFYALKEGFYLTKGEQLKVPTAQARKGFDKILFTLMSPALLPMPFSFGYYLRSSDPKFIEARLCPDLTKRDAFVSILAELEKANWLDTDEVVARTVPQLFGTNIENVENVLRGMVRHDNTLFSLRRLINQPPGQAPVNSITQETTRERETDHIFGRVFFFIDQQFLSALFALNRRILSPSSI